MPLLCCFTFHMEYGIISSSVRAVRLDFVWLAIKKRAASCLRVQMHFSGRSAINPRPPNTVTHGHGDTVALHVACVYGCLVVAVYGDWVLSRTV